MKISQLLETLYLHDSGVNKIEYQPENKQLVLDLELGNYMQEGYQEGEPEVSVGQLVFYDVEEFESDPPFDTLDWQDGSGEISTFGHILERDRDRLEATESIIYHTFYKTHDQTVLILRFLAKDAEWRPE